MTADELANEITNFLNSFGDDRSNQLIKALKRQHRTLQQKTMKTALLLIEAYAETPDNQLDARNEQCKVVAKQMVSGFQKEVDAGTFKPSQYLGSI